MHKNGDLGDILIEEVLAETANDFFGKRKDMENLVTVLNRSAEGLRRKSMVISRYMGFLQYLLVDPEQHAVFFSRLGLEDHLPTNPVSWVDFDKVPPVKRFVAGKRQQLQSLVTWAYEQIQRRCAAYMHGTASHISRDTGEEATDPDVSYAVLKQMVALVNERIKNVNAERSTASVMRFAKSLHPDVAEKEAIAGAMLPEYNTRFNQKMKLALVDFNALAVVSYPDLPSLAIAKPVIRQICKEVFARHKPRVLARIKKVQRR